MKVRGDIVAAVVLGALFLGLYALTVPENHCEADHAFHYAWDVENAPLYEALHHHRLLYVPLAKAVHAGVRILNDEVRAYPVMIGISMVAGAIAMAFIFLTFRRNLGFSREVALFSAGLVGSSYGFWRYACEAEVAVVAAAPLAVAIYVLTSPRINALRVLVGGVAAALAVLLHILAIIPVLFAFPALLMGRGRRAPLLLYILLVIALLVAGYAVSNTSPFPESPHADSGHGDIHLALQGPSALGNAGLGFGQAVLSGNYLFCLRPFRDFMEREFSHRMLREEILIGLQAGSVSAVLPLVILLLLGLVVIFVVDDRLSPPIASEDEKGPPPPDPSASIRRLVLIAMVLWFVLHSLVLLGYEAANPENWVLLMVPLWVGIALLWARDPRGIPRQALGTLFVLLLLHNYFGGMHLLGKEAGDYNRSSSQWIIDHVRENDLILTDETPAYCWFLRYHSPARILSLSHTDSEYMIQSISDVRHSGGHVLATPDVFLPSGGPQQATRDESDEVRSIRQALRPMFVPVSHGQDGRGWVFHPEKANQ
ncbi:MAG: hypothetical protein QGH42_13650 [Kiritimatiellia bacterium]|jgi:hypothetical protein|nr:hypothetical protein [Kiritimatiellia bacterium]MDP6811174.1 hypothetical protein [Kiritimatiellia bacterium]MDP7025269.1 hypothetical protein [Kiritimatiellia bacterium]